MKRILIAILSFFILPIVAFSQSAVNDVDFDITHDYFLLKVKENGDVDVKELIVYDGSFNGIKVNLAFQNPNLSLSSDNYENNAIYNFDGIKNFKVSAKRLNSISYDNFDDTDFTEFDEVSYAELGDQFKYTVDYQPNQNKYMIYNATHNQSVGFLLEYTLDNIVVMHNDVAELYWEIFSSDDDRANMKDVRIKVYLPRSDTKETFRIWTHDILDSNISYIKENGELVGFEVTSSKVNTDDLLDIRATFDKDMITDDYELDHFYKDGLDGIVEVEEYRAELANQKREKLRKIYEAFKTASYIICGVIALGFIYIYFKYIKKPKVDFYAKYYREFIEDYNVEVIDYLYSKNLTPNALTAAIMNLIYKKKIETEEILDAKDTKGKNKNYRFKLLSKEELNESDTFLVEFLFETVGKDGEFTTKQLKSYASSLSTGSKFNASYNRWMNKVKSEGNKQKFFKDKTKGYLVSVGIFIISIIIAVLGGSYGVDYPLVYLQIFIAIALLCVTAGAKAYNEKGALHVKKWNAFKNFLKDFGTFDVKELPEIKLWERYLVYATIFGIADKVQKVMNVRIKELDEYESMSTTNTFTRLYLYDSINHSFTKAVSDGKRAYAASRANAYSSSSSGGGFGGGGSFGGGFGGGGGGRGGF
ncbi:MAG: DUF2207 domain-containing protein [Bacilli bacterium]|nr:DUF2207 domain-containing protein [Bacilli bacterium]